MKGISTLIVLAALFLIVTLVLNGIFLLNILSREENLSRTVREMYIYQGINYIETFKRTFPFLIEFPIYNTLSHDGGELCSYGISSFPTLSSAQEFLNRNPILSVDVPASSINSAVYWISLYFNNYHFYLNRIKSLTQVDSIIEKIVFSFKHVNVDICINNNFDSAKDYYCSSKFKGKYDFTKDICSCQANNQKGLVYDNNCMSFKDACLQSGGIWDESTQKCRCGNVEQEEPCSIKSCGNSINFGKFSCVDRDTLCLVPIDDELSINSIDAVASYLPQNLGYLKDELNATVKVVMNFIQLLDRADEEWLNPESCRGRHETVKSIAEGFSCSEEGEMGSYSDLEACKKDCVYKEEQTCSSTLADSIISALGVGDRNVDEVKGRQVAIKEYSSASVSTNYQFGYCANAGCKCTKEECVKDDQGNCICEETNPDTGECVKYKKKCVQWTKLVKCEYKYWRASASVSVTEKDERNFYPGANQWKQSSFSFGMSLGHVDLGGRTTMDTCAVEKEVERQLKEMCEAKDSGGTWDQDKKTCNCPQDKFYYKGKCTANSVVCNETGGIWNQDSNTCDCPGNKISIQNAYCYDKKLACETEDESQGLVKGTYDSTTNKCICPQGTTSVQDTYCVKNEFLCQETGGTWNPNNAQRPCECDIDKDLVSWGNSCINRKNACEYENPELGIKPGTYDEINRKCTCPEGTEYNNDLGVCTTKKEYLVCSCYKNIVTNEVRCECSLAS